MVSAPVTAPPTMDAGMTRSGSAAANGMAPSLMNDAPSSHAALPFSRSTGVNRSRASRVDANAIASGGTIPAAITAAMMRYGVGFSAEPAASPATAKAYATLLMGPPRSKHIMRPRITPTRTMPDVPARSVSHTFSASMRVAMGRPRKRIMRPDATIEATSGMITTGMRPRSQRGTSRRPMAAATKPASRPPMMPPMKPASISTATAPATKPGAMPGRSAIAKAM